MTPAKMFEGDLWVLASHSVQMAQNAYKNGQADERGACAKICDDRAFQFFTESPFFVEMHELADKIRARGQA
jgi:hypothetical protein